MSDQLLDSQFTYKDIWSVEVESLVEEMIKEGWLTLEENEGFKDQ